MAKHTKRMVQVGWMPDYIAWDIADGEEMSGWDLSIEGLDEVDGDTTFMVNGGTTPHRYLPVFVEVDA